MTANSGAAISRLLISAIGESKRSSTSLRGTEYPRALHILHIPYINLWPLGMSLQHSKAISWKLQLTELSYLERLNTDSVNVFLHS